MLDATKTTSRIGLPTGSTLAYLWKVRVRVQPPTEPPFETTVKAYFAFGTAPDVGARFTALYRPGRQRGARIDHAVPGTFTTGAEQAREPHRYGYKQPTGGIPAVRFDEAPRVGITIDQRGSH
ncbi:MAG TPA: hypothetical protein VLJ76_06230 [Gaiellaceae bacterium]|nr:hypothetical protein [Gaiellaceae bacterium]